jgi:hypothetical protein
VTADCQSNNDPAPARDDRGLFVLETDVEGDDD